MSYCSVFSVKTMKSSYIFYMIVIMKYIFNYKLGRTIKKGTIPTDIYLLLILLFLGLGFLIIYNITAL